MTKSLKCPQQNDIVMANSQLILTKQKCYWNCFLLLLSTLSICFMTQHLFALIEVIPKIVENLKLCCIIASQNVIQFNFDYFTGWSLVHRERIHHEFNRKYIEVVLFIAVIFLMTIDAISYHSIRLVSLSNRKNHVCNPKTITIK